MKTTVATIIDFDGQTGTETWRYRHCGTLAEARKVAKAWAKENPKLVIQIEKGHMDASKDDCFYRFNPFEIWVDGKPGACVGTCVWRDGEPMESLPHPRRC